MAKLTGSSFLSKWNTLFATNGSRNISATNMRDFRQDISDSFSNLSDNLFSGVSGWSHGVNTITDLKAVLTASVAVKSYLCFRDTSNNNVLRVYELVTGTDTESSPDIIRPNDYDGSSNTKVWKLSVCFDYSSFAVTASGTDTYAATLNPAISAYTTNQKIFIKFTNANTGPATLNLNSLGAKNIKKSGSSALASGDIAAGQILSLIYDGTNFQLIGGGGGASSFATLSDGPGVFTGKTLNFVRVNAGETALEYQTPSQVKTDLSLTKSDVGLSNVDNTPDASKPVSTAQAAADAVVLAAAESYTDAQVLAVKAALKWKDSALVATTANITLSGEQTIDGVLTSASRVLVKNQSTGSQNGIYVSASGSWARSTDADSASELESASISVEQGTSNANTTWLQTADNITVGSTSLVWAQFGASVPDADASTKGIAKLYPSTSLGTNTDGSPTQNAVKTYVDNSAETASSIGAIVNGASAATPNNSDLVATVESSVVKKITWTNVKAFLKTYFDSIYQAALGYTAENTANKDATGGYAGLTLFKINFKNALNTFTSFFTNANTAARTYTFQDRDGTIADNTDLALKYTKLVPTAVKTGSYTAVANDLVTTDSTSGTVPITLPTAPADGTLVAIKMVTQGGTNTTTYTCGGGDVFNKSGGATVGTLSLLAQAVVLQYKSSGAIWYILADDLPLPQLDLRFANLVSPALTGTPTAPTAAAGTNTTQIATAAFVQQALNAPLTASRIFMSQNYI